VNKWLRTVWTDPVWSKVIAAAIIAIAGTAYVLIKSAVEQIAPSQILSKVLTVSVPAWALLVAAVASPLLLLLYRFLTRSKYIWVRMDNLSSNMSNCHVSYPRDSFYTVNQLVDRLLLDFEEDNLKNDTFGKAWKIYVPSSRRMIYKRSDKPLKSFGIKAGSVIEIDIVDKKYLT
jgi:hypothetical protein